MSAAVAANKGNKGEDEHGVPTISSRQKVSFNMKLGAYNAKKKEQMAL